VLTVVDQYTSEYVTLLADNTLSGEKVATALDKALLERATPESITVDNGTEFTSKALDHWAYKNSVHLDFIRPGRPVENGYIESFNGKLRDECLNVEVFFNLADARRKLYQLAARLQPPLPSLGAGRPYARGVRRHLRCRRGMCPEASFGTHPSAPLNILA
jgi:transposase InsO family protein